MRNLIKTLVFYCVITFISFGCEENIDKGDNISIEIKKISDFGNENSFLSLKPEYVDDIYYIIKSESDFAKYVTGENIPTIDFDKYFLIIGIKQFTSGASIIEEKAKENNVEIIYTINFQKNDATVALGLGYHAFIEKPINEKEIIVELVVNS